MAKFLNPVEKARKEAKKREIKKNKKKRQEQRLEIEKKKKQATEEALKAATTEIKKPQQSNSSNIATNHSGPKPHEGIGGFNNFRAKPIDKHEQKISRTVPAINSVIESKPVIFKPKISPFIPSSVRDKIKH